MFFLHRLQHFKIENSRKSLAITIVGGFDVHRPQITLDYLDTDSCELNIGQIRPAARAVLRDWLAERFSGRHDVAFAVEDCTGWPFVVEAMVHAGVEPHLGEPADTTTQRGRKKWAKTDRTDARLQPELLLGGRLPESWIPPEHVLEFRPLGRPYVSLMDERCAWQQRIHAKLFHQGVPPVCALLTGEGCMTLATVELSTAGHQMADTVLRAIDSLTELIESLRARLQTAGANPVEALMGHYGIGTLCAAIIWAKFGLPPVLDIGSGRAFSG